MQSVIIKKSNINGNGVFANRNFKKGEVILKWKLDNIISEKEFEKLSDNEKVYINKIYLDKYIVMQSPEKFVNYSCNPNTYCENYCDIALRDIKNGEEITGSYASNNEIIVDFKCNCKEINCKRIIKN